MRGITAENDSAVKPLIAASRSEPEWSGAEDMDAIFRESNVPRQPVTINHLAISTIQSDTHP